MPTQAEDAWMRASQASSPFFTAVIIDTKWRIGCDSPGTVTATPDNQN